MARDDVTRYVQRALSGISPGDVVKIQVSRDSQFFALMFVDLTGVRVQITAESVHTRTKWEQIVSEASR